MNNPVLIVGGYGVVGLQLAHIIRDTHPDLPLILAGRTLRDAEDAAATLGNATGFRLDVNETGPLANQTYPLSAVVAVTNDPDDNLMRAAIGRGIPYLDITRWTERLHEATLLAGILDLKAPVVLSSSWMAGVSAIVAKAAARRLAKVEEIDTAILYRLKDKAGPNSVEYADRLGIPFRVREDGRWKTVKPMSDPARVTFPGGYSGKAYRFDEPSQETLALYTGAQSASSRITYDDAGTTGTMAFLVGSGIWGLLSGPAFTKTRRSIIYHPGEGASHEIVISISGTDSDGQPRKVRATVLDPAGQTHLTAVGAYIQLAETLGLNSGTARPAGTYYPENTENLDEVLRCLQSHAVQIEFTDM
ncbi:MAG: saccharopine dehydrogenase [Alphaproteobacteria bacterium]|nr:saccharopine dehydrogenase [Alphaproteobacteria bacterium]|tara:strand:+ start:7912 stop:8994 length:1083 start_codon:yes stop_codon:yes gene_type:complete